MAFEDCIQKIRSGAAVDLNTKEIEELLTTLSQERDLRRAQGSLDESSANVAEELADRARAKALIEKRNQAINIKSRLTNLRWVTDNFYEDPVEGLLAVMAGTQRLREGGRLSAGSRQAAIEREYIAGFNYDLHEAGVYKLVSAGENDRQLADAIWRLGRGEDMRGVPAEIKTAAEIMVKWREKARADMNKAGAWIGEIDDYIVRQTHDPWKIRRKGMKDKWVAEAKQRFDLQRMMAESPGSSVDDMLESIYNNLATATHSRNLGITDQVAAGPQNIAKKLSAERVIHFKSADDWFEYNRQFGSGSLRETYMGGLIMGAKATGLMQKMGTNPESNLKWMINSLKEKYKKEGRNNLVTELVQKEGTLVNQLKVLDGRADIPGREIGALAFGVYRAWQTASTLGSMIASQFPDIALVASEFRHQGLSNHFSGMGVSIRGLVEGYSKTEKLRVLSSLGVYADSMAGLVTDRFSNRDVLPGMVSNGVQKFMRWSLAQGWNDRIKTAAAMSMSHEWAHLRGNTFDQLNTRQQNVLRQFGITDSRWEALRQGAVDTWEDGREFLTPEGIQSVEDGVIRNVLRAEGRKVTDRNIRAMRDEIQGQFRSYFSDRAEAAIPTPDARTKAWTTRGAQPGTVPGEILRSFFQFKNFFVSYHNKVIQRELYGQGADRISDVGFSELQGLAQIIAMTTALGYVSMTVKDLMKGRTPRETDTPEKAAKVLVSSMLQGGGLGIYGDFLFADHNRFGGGIWSSIGGPLAGDVEEAAKIWSAMIRGDEKTGAKAFKFATDNTPYIDIFYARMALDYLIFNEIQEFLNPGYLRRSEQFIEREYNQDYWLRPSEVAD